MRNQRRNRDFGTARWFMSITRYYKYQGHIDEMSKKYPSFKKAHDFKVKKIPETAWYEKNNGYVTHHLLVTFIGKTGYGKSTTINKFFGKDIMETSAVKACTRECQSIDFKIYDNVYFSFGDMPGIGEDQSKDLDYIKMYKDFLNFSSSVIYILRADMRDYSVDLAAYQKLFSMSKSLARVIFAVNFCDKIEPINRANNFAPTAEQEKNILCKIADIKSIFKPTNKIIPYSASTGWGINNLADEIIRVTQSHCFVE